MILWGCMSAIFFLNTVSVVCLLGVCIISVLAAVSDLRSMTIPNFYSLIVIVLFPVAYGFLVLTAATPAPWWSYVSSFFIIFLVTLAMFLVGAIGGGDSKFAAACALWVGLQGLVVFLLVMMIVGMVLAIFALVLRNRIVFARAMPGGWIDRVQKGESAIPYGVAITCGLGAGLYAGGMLDPAMSFFH